MIDLLTRSTDAPVVAVDTAARTVTVRLCRWNERRTVNDPDRTYRERFPPGSLELADDVHVVDRHRGALIGRAVPESMADDDVGPTVDLLLARTAAGDDTLALIDAGVIRSVSMELEPLEEQTDRDGTVTRIRSRVHGVAFAFRPAHDAPILATRSTDGDQTMTDTATAPDTLTREQVADMVADLVTREQFDAVLDDVRRDAIADRGRDGVGAHPLARFRSLVDYADTMWTDSDGIATLHRALADQITANNPGVVPPAWVSSIAGIIDQARPTITAFGSTGLPPAGMELSWPFFDGDLTTLVGEQLTEKSAIVSVRVDLERGTEPIRTFAGGSDISYQLIRRSDPAYRDAYLRIMMNAYAVVTNAAAAADAVAAATASTGVWDPAAGTFPQLVEALVRASVEISKATGAPAAFALVGETVFVEAAVATAVNQSVNGGEGGTASAGTLTVNVSGVPMILDPSLPATAFIVSNALTAEWFEDGPFTVTAEDVEKLGQNVAVWGMGAFAATLPAGIRSVDDGVAVARTAAAKKG